MIISFVLENWMSFSDPVSFSMLASRERQHRDRIPKVEKYQTSILPVAVIYGGNASGKTNFFKALNFMRNYIVRGSSQDSLIQIEPFLLDKSFISKPTRFKIELLIDEVIYEFSFAVTSRRVIEEKLVKISSTREKTLYDRNYDQITIDPELGNNDFLKFAFQGTRENQLYLTNSVSQKVDAFRPVYDWFRNNLVMVGPNWKYLSIEDFIDEDQPNYALMNKMLSSLDTGISRLGGEDVPFESVSLSEKIKNQIRDEIEEGKTIPYNKLNEKWLFTRLDGEIRAKKVITYHLSSESIDEKFDISQESDGSRRVIDILPAFISIASPASKKVFFIDELDRSLHTLLTRKLLEDYLNCCTPGSRAQMLITTHDVLLMDQKLFRRDEMWVTERKQNGNSTLMSFSEYKDVRFDKDIRKSYLQGRLGGIPKLVLNNDLNCNGRNGK